jgi:CDP-6-deoxy-D-xylo-4-hexulose-3-dehydrase
MTERIFYSSSVHDEREIEAVVEVLRSGPQGLWPGRRVTAMEREVAALFGKAHGVMCNSGSSALYLALELLDLPKGAEVVTCALTFSTDVAPIVRGGWTPAFVDVEPGTYCVDVDAIEEMITDRTAAILVPNLIGNAPDWDRIRQIADAHGLPVIEDSCDTLGARLRGRPTGERSTISVTSFANSHIITCAGNGGMVLTDDSTRRDRAVMLRRWGRRSELHFFGSKKRQHDFWEDLDGVHYDNQFIFDELAWNFEPSETVTSNSSPGTASGSCSPARSKVWRRPGSATRSRSHPRPGSSEPPCRSSWTAGASTRGRSGRATSPASPCCTTSPSGSPTVDCPRPTP